MSATTGGIRWNCAWITSALPARRIFGWGIDNGIWNVVFCPLKLGRRSDKHLLIEVLRRLWLHKTKQNGNPSTGLFCTYLPAVHLT